MKKKIIIILIFWLPLELVKIWQSCYSISQNLKIRAIFFTKNHLYVSKSQISNPKNGKLQTPFYPHPKTTANGCQFTLAIILTLRI